MNGMTGNPLAKAQVTLRGTGTRSSVSQVVQTDDAGHFILNGLEPGKYKVRAERVGYLPMESEASLEQSGSTDQVAKQINLILQPPGVIAGRVVGEDGDPVPNARVTVFILRDRNLSRVGRTYTNDLGEYRLFGLLPGRYYVSLAYQSHRLNGSGASTAEASAAQDANTPKYYPNAKSLEDATALNISAGTVLTGVDFSLSGMGSASSQARAQQSDSGNKALLEGEVTNAVTGFPVPRAHVVLRGAEEKVIANAVTDSSGNFSLPEVEPGSYQISASCSGFRWDAHGPRRSGKSVTVSGGETLKDLVIKLIPQGVIAGRVLFDDEPLPNAVVIALNGTTMHGKRQFNVVNRTYTNDLGEYRLFALPPGHYYVSTAYPHGKPGSPQPVEPTAGGEGYGAAYYPNVSNVEEASVLEVGGGRVLSGIDLTLTKVRKLKIDGRVVGAEKRLGKNVRIALIPEKAAVTKFNRHDVPLQAVTGEFKFDEVLPGAYMLVVDWFNGRRWYSGRHAINVANADISGVIVPLVPAMQIQGRLQTGGSDKFDPSGVTVSLQSNGTMAGAGSATVKADGSFAIADVRPNTYRIQVSGLKGNYYVKSISLGAQDVTGSEVNLTGGAGGAINVVVSPAGGKIQGVVLDDQQRPSNVGTVILVPDHELRERSELYKSVGTDQSGRFTLQGIPPGQYKLFASNDMDLDSLQNPGTLTSLENLGVPVSVEENSMQTMQLKLISVEQNQ